MAAHDRSPQQRPLDFAHYVAHNKAMQIRFAQSARRHRIGKAHARYVMSEYEPTHVPADDEHGERLVWVGTDDRGLELEIAAVVETDYLLVIHLMPRLFNRRAR